MIPLLKRYITALNICKKIKTCEKSITIIKLTDEDLSEKNNSNKEDFKNNILFKTIKFFFGKELSSNSLNNKELKLPFLPPLYYL